MADAQLFDRFKLSLNSKNISVECGSYAREEDQQRTRYYAFRPDSDNGKFLLSVHGTGNDALYPQVHLFAEFLTQGYNVFAFDVDGHGGGSSTKLGEASYESMLPAAITQLRQIFPTGPIFLYGHSLGAVFAMHYLAREPNNDITAAVLVSPPFELRENPLRYVSELLAPFKRSFYRYLPVYGISNYLPAIGSFKRDRFPVRLANQRAGAFGYYNYVRELHTHMLLELASAQPIKTPCQLIYGSHDAITPPWHGEQFKKLLPTCNVSVFENESHFTLTMSEAMIASLPTFLGNKG